MTKRGQTDYSLLLGIDKPSGISSHDVVNKVRTIFGERRVGHGGTLDPLTTGALYIMVGCATRLDKYLASESKQYRATITFGFSTATDDSEGEILDKSKPTSLFSEEGFAATSLNAIIGEAMQLPPVYSAIKIDGKKSYEQARRGNVLELKPIHINIFKAELVSINSADDGSTVNWTVEFDVSKGTYIRSIARDLGKSLGCPAHLSSLTRMRSGRLELVDCASMSELEDEKENVALDPVVMLGYRFFFANDSISRQVENGNAIAKDDVLIHEYTIDPRKAICSCTSGICESQGAPNDDELFSVIVDNKLKAIYRYVAAKERYVPDCVFQIGVSRGLGY